MPASAAAAPEPSAPGGPVPAEVTPEADAGLPDLPPPESRQEGAGPGGDEQVVAPEADAGLPDLPPPESRQEGAGPSGEEQVVAPGAAPTGSTGTRLPARGLMPGSEHNVVTTSYACRCPAAAVRRSRRALGESP
jgi:hypothetical protein